MGSCDDTAASSKQLEGTIIPLKFGEVDQNNPQFPNNPQLSMNSQMKDRPFSYISGNINNTNQASENVISNQGEKRDYPQKNPLPNISDNGNYELNQIFQGQYNYNSMPNKLTIQMNNVRQLSNNGMGNLETLNNIGFKGSNILQNI